MSNFSSFAQNHHRSHDRLILVAIFLLFGVTFRTNSYVSCARSSASSSSPGASSESTGATGSSSSSQGSSSSSSNRERERELISAQFRAAQDSHRDLDPIGDTDTLTAAAAAASLAEEEALAKYMAASASAYSPSKLRMNKYSQTGFYDPYPSYAAAFSNVPSSYYPFNGYTSYKDNPMIDTYPYYERDRLREIQTRAMSQLTPASYSSSNGGSSSSISSSSNRDGFGSNFFGGGGGGGSYREGFRSSDQDSSAMSSGHGGGHDDHHGHGSGHGHGHGWGHTNHYTSKVNTNAIGLLGLLGLLSLLSNVLLLFTTTTTTTTAAARRTKRRAAAAGNSNDVRDETQEERRQRIFMEILPHLTPVAHARDGVLPVECTFHGVCMANKILVNELGVHGRSAGTRISSAIVKLLDKVTPKKASSKSKEKSDIRKKLESAGLQGRNKENCEKKYPVCKALRKQSAPSLPFVITMQDLPKLISKVSKLSQNGFNVPMNL